MNPLFYNRHLPHHIEYLEIDPQFNILTLSRNVRKFAEAPEAVKLGCDARLGFPELFGSEQCLQAILEGERTHFELEGISRSNPHNTLIYLNMHVVREDREKSQGQKLMVCFENVTEKTIRYQRMLHHANETELLARQLKISQDYIHTIITFMTDALIVTRPSGRIKTMNPAASKLFGYSETELIDRAITEIVSPETLAQLDSDRTTTEITYQTPEGQHRYIEFSHSPMQTELEDWQGTIYIGRDITALKQTKMALEQANVQLRERNQELHKQSTQDPLTGLYNRRYLMDFLPQAIPTATQKDQNLSVVMLDVDHFKRFNDTFGHEAGDLVLCELGKFLENSIRDRDIACRYGGEEFTLIMQNIPPATTQQRLEFIKEGVKKLQLQLNGQSLGKISISVGIACFPLHGSTAEDLIRTADKALYAAKAAGRDRVVMASPREPS